MPALTLLCHRLRTPGTRDLALCLAVIFLAAGTGREAAAEEVSALLERHTERLMALPGVVGVGEGSCEGASCILVLVVKRTPELEKQIPSQLEGVPVSIKVTGEIIAEPAE